MRTSSSPLTKATFEFHNTLITMDINTQPLVTSLYDWETGIFEMSPFQAKIARLVSFGRAATGGVKKVCLKEDARYRVASAKDAVELRKMRGNGGLNHTTNKGFTLIFYSSSRSTDPDG